MARFAGVRSVGLRSNIDDLSVRLQRSGDLGAWEDFFSINEALQSGFTSPLILDGEFSPEINRFTLRNDQPLGEENSDQFFRLKVGVPEETP